ncbi:hypothetical protein BCR42DRAFT_412088 [Absidia repens]|uniref:Uncharacterized protein n=1 Tax=Absidia repens TaxID=90262 RepID=A0A1X2IMP1_9FUNG|nr:hypothetical protein BCR42DRAFT_412088 [Absidia repens]
MEISKDQAICMFFYVEYTEENVMKYKKVLEDFGDVEICYNTDPKQPILVTERKIHECPLVYRLYPANISSENQPWI